MPAAKPFTEQSFANLVKLLAARQTTKDKILCVRDEVYSQGDYYFAMLKVEGSEGHEHIIGSSSCSFRFNFDVYVNSFGRLQYNLSHRCTHLVGDEEYEAVLIRILKKAASNLKSKGGGTPYGFYLKATELSATHRIDQKYWNLALDCRQFHDAFKDFGVANRVECGFRER